MSYYQYDIYKVQRVEDERKAQEQEIIDMLQTEKKSHHSAKFSFKTITSWLFDVFVYLTQPMHSRQADYPIRNQRKIA